MISAAASLMSEAQKNVVIKNIGASWNEVVVWFLICFLDNQHFVKEKSLQYLLYCR